jgi:hypothetical protein
MTFQLVRAELKSGEPKEVAKVLFDFFVFQHEAAIKEEINSRCEYNGMLAANRAAEDEYKKEDFSGGFGPNLPYNEYAIKVSKTKSDNALISRSESKIFLDFMRDRFLEKFI